MERAVTAKKARRTVVSLGVKLAVVVVIFMLLFRPQWFGLPADAFGGLSTGGIVDALQGVESGPGLYGWLVFAVSAKLTGIFSGIIRWRTLLAVQNVRLPFFMLAKLWFWGRAVGLFLPGTLGLDGYRLAASARLTRNIAGCTAAILVEKVTGFAALFVLLLVTLPLGLRILPIQPLVMAGLILVFGGIIATALLALLRPLLFSRLLRRLPLPRAIEPRIEPFIAAAEAYHGRTATIIAAVLLGNGVHLGTCFMYFGIGAALRAPESSTLLDVLFASPLIILGSVLAITVSGIGVREAVMTALLGPRIGASQAFLFGHLGLWVGEIIPLFLSLPLLLWHGKPPSAGPEELPHETAV